MNLVDPTEVNVSPGAHLTFNNALNLNGNTLTKMGAGTLAINNVLTSAGGLIGKQVRALTSQSLDGQQQFVEGQVEKVAIENGKPVLYVNGDPIKLENVSEILPASE